MKKYTHFSARAPLALLGKYVRRKGIWRPIERLVHIPQKRIGHAPIAKLMDAWINILSGGHGVVEVNTRLRSEPGIQKAFGRRACAEQSSVSRTLNACTPEQVEQLRQALQVIFRKHGRSYHHNYEQGLQWLDVDMTGLLAGEQGEGVTKGYFSNAPRKRGRQVGRVLATRYREVLVDRLYPGTVQLERALQELVSAAEQVLQLDAARRQRTLLRVDGGGGRDADVNWLLRREDYVLAKVKNWQRARKLLRQVATWHPDQKDPQRQIGWIEPGHAYERPTRQIGIQETRSDGRIYRYVLVFNLSDELLYQLNGLPPQPDPSPQQLLSLALNLYDLRSGGVETANRNSKSGLGLNKRNKRRFAAQEMLVLLAQLAYNVLTWFHRLLLQPRSPFRGYGWLRLVRDLFHITGKLHFGEQGELLAITLNRDHRLAKPLVDSLAAAGAFDELALILRKI